MNLQSLDLAIGLVVVFLLVSTLCSALREGIEAVLKTRAAYLERALRELLDDPNGSGLAKSLFEHPLLSGLYLGRYKPKPLAKASWILANGRGLPSYIPARTVARALLDIVARGDAAKPTSVDGSAPDMSLSALRAGVSNLTSERIQRVLLNALDVSRGDLAAAQKALEDWFDDSMDRVAGWYKRSTQWVLFAIAITVTVAANVDSLAIAKHLQQDEAARAAAVEVAHSLTKEGSPPPKEQALDRLHALELPIGWQESTLPEGIGWLNRALGWLITAVAATLGAPFWFDVLNKIMVIRSTVKPREKSPEEFSEDRQRSAVLPTPVVAAPGALATVAVKAPSAQPTAEPEDPEELDCCGDSGVEPTRDEELPAATGGVAP